MGQHTHSVHRLLNHLERVGFNYSPRVVGVVDDREVVSYIAGEVDEYAVLKSRDPDQTIRQAATLLRQYHDATISFALKADDYWQLPVKNPVEVMCHGDFAPYNVVLNNEHIVGVIDCEMIHPGSRVWDVAYAVYRFVPWCSDVGHYSSLTIDEKLRRTRLFCESYGGLDCAELFAAMVERIESLLDYINQMASRGVVKYQQAIIDKHDLIYKQDIVQLTALIK